jgi:Protein of unknown function (DUF3011)/Amidohydrolase
MAHGVLQRVPMSSPIPSDIAACEAATRARLAATTLLLLVFLATPATAQDTEDDPPMSQNAATPQGAATTVTCASKPGERSNCAADTSKGVVLLRSTGDAPCLLGRTWDYDQTSVWVADGCSAEFGTGPAQEPETKKPRPLSHIPNVGFLLFDGDKGQIYFRLFSYARYLNQRNLDDSFVDAFGNTHTVQRRQDIQHVLRAVLGVVPHAEDALLPLRLVVKHGGQRRDAGTHAHEPVEGPSQVARAHDLCRIGDAPLYYYSFTDAYIASVYRALSKDEQARFDPMITGFNPADMYGVDHIRRVLTTFPGVFTGIGEFTIHKEFVSSKVSGETASLTNPGLDRILDFAAEAGLVVILHNDVDMPFAKPDSEPVYLTQMKALLKRHPKTAIIWAHVGVGRIAGPAPYYAVFEMWAPIRRLLTPEASVKVRKGNYERIFDEGRRRVRAWEAANVK